MNAHDDTPGAADQAIGDRLARLADRPVDTAAFEARLTAALEGGATRQQLPHRASRVPAWLGLAAAVALVAAVGWSMLHSPTAASAAPMDLSALHTYVLEGEGRIAPATTVQDVATSIRRQLDHTDNLPAPLRDARIQSCCLAHVQAQLAAVALLDIDGTPVTFVVAEAPDFAHEMGTVIEIDGRRFFGHEHAGIPMMMSHHDDRWLCVMGHVDAPTLAQFAAAVDISSTQAGE